MMKINVDAAISKNLCRSVAAAIARDGAGTFQGASVLVVHGITDPETMEAIACREGLALASDLMFRKVRLASDNVSVVRSFKGDGKDVQEIKASSAAFESFDFVHEGRVSNVDDHCLARSCVNCELGRQVWLLSPPEGVCTSVHQNDQ